MVNKSSRLSCFILLLSAAFSGDAFGQDFLDLRIPRFLIDDDTTRSALMELHRWGVRVCLEEADPESRAPENRMTIDVENYSIREILDLLTSTDPRYTWERYGTTQLINVYPVAAVNDPDYLNQLRIEEVWFPSLQGPVGAVFRIAEQAPELFRRVYPGGLAGSSLGGIGEGPVDTRFEFRFYGLTVREILNEIVLCQDGLA